MFRLIILGAAAGGGLPQWNCGCANCVAARNGSPNVKPATQASVAVSGDDGDSWLIVNASPDLRQQIAATAALHARAKRQTPVAGVILTNAEIDAVTGLLSLREGSPFALYAHPDVHATLAANSVFSVLPRDRVRRVDLRLDSSFDAVGLSITPFSVLGKEALYLEGAAGNSEGDTLGLIVRHAPSGKSVAIVTACANVTDDLHARLAECDVILFDGTLWQDDELISLGLGQKTGRRMGHIAMSGGSGAIAALADLPAARKIFIHINNTNPVWPLDSPERRDAAAAGWEIGFDGMEIVP